MAPSKSMSPRVRFTPAAPATPSRTTMSRSRTAEEVIDGMFVAMARVHALEGVTAYGVKSMTAIERMRVEIAEELPEISPIIWALEVNAARLIGQVQSGLLGDTTQVIV